MHRRPDRGVTLLDTVVGVSIMLVIFLGIAGAFRLSVDVVTNNKARSGAIALAGERMEYLRSLPYDSLGTVGGVPSGTIPQSETVTLNGVDYTRRTYIAYGDDPADGAGASDSNGIPEDYKAAKVDVSWVEHGITRDILLVSRFETSNGMEVACGTCGTLVVDAVDSASQPLSGATVTIVNASTSPTVDLTTYTDASGTATVIGATAAAGYQITVTKSGYSTAQTYGATVQNTNPSPGHLTVAAGQTTTGSFAIDLLSQKTIKTWTQILDGAWGDSFGDTTQIATSTGVEVSGGVAHLSGSSGSYPASGNFRSVGVTPSNLYSWGTFDATTTTPSGTDIRFQVYDGGGNTLVPDTMLPGNSLGFSSTTVDLSGISTTTFTSLSVVSTLETTDASSTPSIDTDSVSYKYGPNALASIPFTLQLDKPVGSGPAGTVYKFSGNYQSGSAGYIDVPSLEWGTYELSVASSTGYDIASVCHPSSETAGLTSMTKFALLPNTQTTSDVYLAAHTSDSLLVDVRSAATGTLIPNATVGLSRSTVYAATSTTDGCGQTLFSGLISATNYNVYVTANGYTSYLGTNVTASGQSAVDVTLN